METGDVSSIFQSKKTTFGLTLTIASKFQHTQKFFVFWGGGGLVNITIGVSLKQFQTYFIGMVGLQEVVKEAPPPIAPLSRDEGERGTRGVTGVAGFTEVEGVTAAENIGVLGVTIGEPSYKPDEEGIYKKHIRTDQEVVKIGLALTPGTMYVF